MRALLIQSPMPQAAGPPEPFPPLGLGYVASMLEADAPNPDAFPFPARHLFEFGMCFPAIVSSRGCPCQCSFCSPGAMAQGYRARSAENVVDELRTQDLSHVVTFCDNTFAGSRRVEVELCQAILQTGWRSVGRASFTPEARTGNSYP